MPVPVPTVELNTIDDALRMLHCRVLLGLCEQNGQYNSRELDLLFDASRLLKDKRLWMQCKRTGLGCKDAMIQAVRTMQQEQEGGDMMPPSEPKARRTRRRKEGRMWWHHTGKCTDSSDCSTEYCSVLM